MGVEPKLRVTIKPVSFSPLQKAELEIIALRSLRELQQDSRIGGPMPQEMKEENERKRAEYERRKLAIIKKHGVVQEYLEPLLLEEKRLSWALREIQRRIAELRNLEA